MFNKTSICFYLMFMAIAMSSCINEEYDISDGIDMDMTLLKNVSIPIGNVEKITVDELLVIDEDDENITVDGKGNYSISFAGTTITEELVVPEVNLDDIQSEPTTVIMSTGRFAGQNHSQAQEVISYKDIHGKALSFSMDIEIDQNMPSEVKSIRKVFFSPSELQLSMNFEIQDGVVYLAEGYTITFSDHISLSPLETDEYTVSENSIIFRKDIKVAARSPYTCSFHIDHFTFEDDAVTVSGGASRLVYTDHVAFEGEVFALTSDYEIVPDELSFEVQAGIHDLYIESAELKVEFDVNIADDSFGFSDMPEFLAGDNVCIDLYNPQLRLDIDNGSPAGFMISADVAAYKENEELTSLELGPYDVEPESNHSIVIARRESDIDNVLPETGYRYDVVPEIGDFFKNLPDEIRVSDVNLTTSDEYFMLSPGSAYETRFDYELFSDLAFDKDLSLEFTQDIKDLNLVFDTGVPSAELSLVIVNSVPADFIITAVGLDNEGREIPDMTLTVDKAIASGSHLSPVETSLVLTLRNPSKTLELDGLRLGMKAKAGKPEYHGVALNRNQGLELKDIVLTLPDGITFMNDSEN